MLKIFRSTIFKKASQLMRDGRISIAAISSDKITFKVNSNETHYVVIKQNHAVTYECDCEFYLRKARNGRTVICSHALACLIYLFEKEKNWGGGCVK